MNVLFVNKIDGKISSSWIVRLKYQTCWTTCSPSWWNKTYLDLSWFFSWKQEGGGLLQRLWTHWTDSQKRANSESLACDISILIITENVTQELMLWSKAKKTRAIIEIRGHFRGRQKLQASYGKSSKTKNGKKRTYSTVWHRIHSKIVFLLWEPECRRNKMPNVEHFSQHWTTADKWAI